MYNVQLEVYRVETSENTYTNIIASDIKQLPFNYYCKKLFFLFNIKYVFKYPQET